MKHIHSRYERVIMSKENESYYNHRAHISTVIRDIFSLSNEELKYETSNIIAGLFMHSYIMGAPLWLDKLEGKTFSTSYEQDFYLNTMKFAIALTTNPYDEYKQERYNEGIGEFKYNEEIIDRSFKTITETLANYHLLYREKGPEEEIQKMIHLVKGVSRLLKATTCWTEKSYYVER